MIEVPINNETEFDIPTESLRAVVQTIAADHGFSQGEISLAVIDDPTMHRLNREHLQHDYPTDVLSFVFDADESLEGEVIASADTAKKIAPEYEWSAESELLLYFIHGTLHLVGHDDHEDVARQAMRDRESHYLKSIGIQPPVGHTDRTLREGTSA